MINPLEHLPHVHPENIPTQSDMGGGGVGVLFLLSLYITRSGKNFKFIGLGFIILGDSN